MVEQTSDTTQPSAGAFPDEGGQANVSVRTCRNCSGPLDGPFCVACGQKDREVRRPFLSISKDLIHAALELDGRAYRTLFYLFTRPGFLSTEFVSGRQASYTPPLRLFLVLSITLFALISLNSVITNINGEPLVEAPEFQERRAEFRQELDSNEDIQGVLEFLGRVELPMLGADANARFSAYLQNQFRANSERIMADPGAFLFASLDYITVFILLMMPVLAMIQALLYIRSRSFFIEHLILTMHNHSFVILVFLLLMPIGLVEDSNITIVAIVANFTSSLLILWLIAYLYFSLKNFFGQGHFKTLLKFTFSTLVYGIALILGLAMLFVLIFFLS